MVYPKELMFDTQYHLTWEGKRRNTALLIARLAEHHDKNRETSR